jgi:sugar phosphate isomerase/epimerase
MFGFSASDVGAFVQRIQADWKKNFFNAFNNCLVAAAPYKRRVLLRLGSTAFFHRFNAIYPASGPRSFSFISLGAGVCSGKKFYITHPKIHIMKKYLLMPLFVVALFSHTLPAQTEVGLQLYSLRNQFKEEVPGTLRMIEDWGIREIEGGGTYGLPMPEFKKLLKEHKLKVVSVGADYNQLKENPQAAIDNAKAFGAKYVVCFWIPHDGDSFTLENMQDAVKVFNSAGKKLAENGLSLCYHPHGYEFRPYQQGTLFDYLVKETDPRYLNFEMDVFWVKHAGQDPVALLEKYPKRFLLMHLKDRKHGTEGNQNGHADVETNVVLGSGDVGIAEVMKAAKKAGVKHYFIEDESSRSVIQIPQSLQYLKSMKTFQKINNR